MLPAKSEPTLPDCAATGFIAHREQSWISVCRTIRWLISVSVVAVFIAIALSGVTRAASPEYRKVLFLGNSITKHGPSKKVDWSGNWGMAASAADKDFVHLVANSLSKTAGDSPKTMIENIATFERQYATYDVGKMMEKYREFGPDLVIVAIGENVPPLKTEEEAEQFGASLGKLFKGLKQGGNPTIVVRSCFWANGPKDKVLREACEEVDGIFVDIGSLGKDESNYARSERDYSHAGVAAHPGDKGMQAIADAIVEAIEKR